MYNKTCEIVKDLLPLYVDNVCTGESREMVTRHLTECPECRELEKKIRDTNIERIVEQERDGVLTRHAKKERSAAWKAGMIIGAILTFPIVVMCLVVAAGVGDFEVLPILVSAMMLVASLIVVPLMSKQDKFVRMLIASISSLMILEYCACFALGESFARAAVPTIFGLSLPFAPFIVRKLDLPDTIKNRKVMTVICWDLLWFFLTLIIETLPYGTTNVFNEGMLVSMLLIVVAASVFGAIKLSNSQLDRFNKSVIAVIMIGLWIAFFKFMARQMTSGFGSFFSSLFKLSNWSPAIIFTNIVTTTVGTLIFAAAVYAAASVVKAIINEQ